MIVFSTDDDTKRTKITKMFTAILNNTIGQRRIEHSTIDQFRGSKPDTLFSNPFQTVVFVISRSHSVQIRRKVSSLKW